MSTYLRIQLFIVALFFYYGVGFLQIPYGYLIDSKGFEKILPFCIFAVLIGSLVYWLCDNHIFIGISRLIIGAGCASSYILVIFIATTYFKKL
ncbi:putative membrane protein [Francisella tularensis]|nr:putative membrane protein [Francisella tularensis]